MKTIEKISVDKFNRDWIYGNDFFTNGFLRKEFYLNVDKDILENLINMFYDLFGFRKEKLVVRNVGEWGDFCLETWNPENNIYDYSFQGKAPKTKLYLSLLIDSDIEFSYTGFCKCNDWEKFLKIIIPLVLNNSAPYSPLIFDVDNQFVFYFHHTGSIGMLFKEKNEIVEKILYLAEENNYRTKAKG